MWQPMNFLNMYVYENEAQKVSAKQQLQSKPRKFIQQIEDH